MNDDVKNFPVSCGDILIYNADGDWHKLCTGLILACDGDKHISDSDCVNLTLLSSFPFDDVNDTNTRIERVWFTRSHLIRILEGHSVDWIVHRPMLMLIKFVQQVSGD